MIGIHLAKRVVPLNVIITDIIHEALSIQIECVDGLLVGYINLWFFGVGYDAIPINGSMVLLYLSLYVEVEYYGRSLGRPWNQIQLNQIKFPLQRTILN